MLVDTSVWIDFILARSSPASARLTRALEREQPLYMPPVVMQEVLQGARDAAHFERLRYSLEQIGTYIAPDPAGLHESAALLYTRCRWAGITLRSSNDCLVAASALEADLPLLANDRDFVHLARVEPRLRLVQ